MFRQAPSCYTGLCCGFVLRVHLPSMLLLRVVPILVSFRPGLVKNRSRGGDPKLAFFGGIGIGIGPNDRFHLSLSSVCSSSPPATPAKF